MGKKKGEQPAQAWLEKAKEGSSMHIAVDQDIVTEITVGKKKN